MKRLTIMIASLLVATSAHAQFDGIGQKKPIPAPTPVLAPVPAPSPPAAAASVLSPAAAPAAAAPPSVPAPATSPAAPRPKPTSPAAARTVPVAPASLSYLADFTRVFDDGTAAAAQSTGRP